MRTRPDLRLGIDVGGTNTDAVVIGPDDSVIAKAKIATSPDVTGGIFASIEEVLGGLDHRRVTHVMIGTTHATNALLQRRPMRKVAVLRIGAPATRAVEPLLTWPSDLRSAVCSGWAIVGGGIEFDGRDLAPFDAEAVARFFDTQAGQAESVAITSVFSPISERHELAAAELARSIMGDVHVSLSHEIGTIGLLERENATVLNAALGGVAQDVAQALSAALARHGLYPTTYFSQNDGTLMAMDQAIRYPVLTIGCGPANSMRGAAHLSGATDALVVDVGGTSTEVGSLINGFPSSTGDVIGIGGVRTNFRMPDLVAVPVGGGTVVTRSDGRVRLGPDSVGRELSAAALVFGGETLTLTDAAVAGGRASIGHVHLPSSTRRILADALERSDAILIDAIDRAKLVRGEPPLIVVGGASFLVPDEVPGVSEIRRPEHFEVANAIGAAIAFVGGQIDRIVHFGPGGRRAAVDQACDAARAQAIRAGADPERTEIVEIEEAPLSYLTDPAVRIRVRAAGPIGYV